MKKREIVPNLICVSDTHIGCRMGLFTLASFKLDDGGYYVPSTFQRKVASWWKEFWDVWVPLVCRDEPLAIVHVGDAIDGVHHNSTTQISQNLTDQRKMAEAMLRPLIERCEGRFYMIRGTEAHDGKAGAEMEQLATNLGAIPDSEGRHARYLLWKYVGPTGCKKSKQNAGLVNILHHIGTTGSQHFETSAPHKELMEAFAEAGRWNQEPPDAIVRAHRHRYTKTEAPSASGRCMSIVLPGWQGKTPFAHRIAGCRQTEPQFGGVLLRHGDEEKLYERHWVRAFDRPDAE